MKRRRFLAGALALGAVLPAACSPSRARAAPRVGYIQVGSTGDEIRDEFRLAMHELGYREGDNVLIEWRNANGRPEALPQLARDLVALKVDVIVTGSVPSLDAARAATTTIPIVFASVPDPVASGLVSSVARPGGNLTGVLPPDPLTIQPKRLQLFKETIPIMSRVAIVYAQIDPQLAVAAATVQAAVTIGIEALSVGVESPYDLGASFDKIIEARADALFWLASNPINLRRAELLRFARDRRLPDSHASRALVVAGGLMSYGPASHGMRDVALYVDRILEGANPGDLPLVSPSDFAFAINRRTADELELAIAPQVASQVTEWIR